MSIWFPVQTCFPQVFSPASKTELLFCLPWFCSFRGPFFWKQCLFTDWGYPLLRCPIYLFIYLLWASEKLTTCCEFPDNDMWTSYNALPVTEKFTIHYRNMIWPIPYCNNMLWKSHNVLPKICEFIFSNTLQKSCVLIRCDILAMYCDFFTTLCHNMVWPLWLAILDLLLRVSLLPQKWCLSNGAIANLMYMFR